MSTFCTAPLSTTGIKECPAFKYEVSHYLVIFCQPPVLTQVADIYYFYLSFKRFPARVKQLIILLGGEQKIKNGERTHNEKRVLFLNRQWT